MGSLSLAPSPALPGNTHLPLGGFDEQHGGFVAFTARVEPAEKDTGWGWGRWSPGQAVLAVPARSQRAWHGVVHGNMPGTSTGLPVPRQCPGVGAHLAQPLPSPLSHPGDPERSPAGSPAAPEVPRVSCAAPFSSTEPCPGSPHARPRGAGEASPLQAAAILGGGEEQQRGKEREALGDPGPDQAHLLHRDRAGAEVLHVHSQGEARPARGGTSAWALGPLCFGDTAPAAASVLLCAP